ncbi:MAG: hypothetical protein JWM43_3923 [Acidobacteriaceae bacterium]|nr:hypothetical protein [Acidobacteriaceae bacterium]
MESLFARSFLTLKGMFEIVEVSHEEVRPIRHKLLLSHRDAAPLWCRRVLSVGKELKSAPCSKADRVAHIYCGHFYFWAAAHTNFQLEP